jgi:hypothetical protein
VPTVGLTLVVAIAPAIAPTIMITAVALERLERHLLGPAHPRAASRPAELHADHMTCPRSISAAPDPPAGAMAIGQSQPRQRNSTSSPPAPTTISTALVTNPAGWEKPGIGHVLAVEAGDRGGTAMIAAQAASLRVVMLSWMPCSPSWSPAFLRRGRGRPSRPRLGLGRGRRAGTK